MLLPHFSWGAETCTSTYCKEQGFSQLPSGWLNRKYSFMCFLQVPHVVLVWLEKGLGFYILQTWTVTCESEPFGLLSWGWSRWKHHVLLWLFACLCYRRIYPRNFVGPAMLRWRNTVSTQTYDDTCIYFHDFPCISRIFCIINQHVFDRICMTFMVASPVIQANSCKPAFFQLAKKWFYKTRFKKRRSKKSRNLQKKLS